MATEPTGTGPSGRGTAGEMESPSGEILQRIGIENDGLLTAIRGLSDQVPRAARAIAFEPSRVLASISPDPYSITNR